MRLKNNRVTQAIVSRHSFEAGVMDMFKNIFKSAPKKDTTEFELEQTFEQDKKFKELLEKTFLKPKWVEDNCLEFVSLDNHKFPFLSIVETKNDFVTAEELTKGLDSFNKTLEDSLSNYIKVLKWGNGTFEKANAELFKVRPNDSDYKDGNFDEDDLTDEENEEAKKIIDGIVKKYTPEYKKLNDSLKPITAKFTDTLINDKSEFKLTGKLRELKIELSEVVKFLDYFKTKTLKDEDSILYSIDLPPYFDYSCTLYTFEQGRVDASELTFGSHVHQGYYDTGDVTDFVSLKTLIDVLKEFIDK